MNALILWWLLFDISPEYSVAFLSDYPNMLDVPEAIYIITEGLRAMDKKTRKIAIRNLHDLTQERYHARVFLSIFNIHLVIFIKMIHPMMI
jgi:hypothetical protein